MPEITRISRQKKKPVHKQLSMTIALYILEPNNWHTCILYTLPRLILKFNELSVLAIGVLMWTWYWCANNVARFYRREKGIHCSSKSWVQFVQSLMIYFIPSVWPNIHTHTHSRLPTWLTNCLHADIGFGGLVPFFGPFPIKVRLIACTCCKWLCGGVHWASVVYGALGWGHNAYVHHNNVVAMAMEVARPLLP